MTAKPFDVLVIGEGLSGITAAAAAARQGARVMLATSGPGTFVLGTAAIDLDGLEAADLGLAGYGAEELREAVEFFVELTDSAGCAYSGNTRERRWIPTVMGTFQEVSLAPTLPVAGRPAQSDSGRGCRHRESAWFRCELCGRAAGLP